MDFTSQHGLPVAHSGSSLCQLGVSTHLFQLHHPEAGGQLQGCVKNGWEMILKAITLKSNM